MEECLADKPTTEAAHDSAQNDSDGALARRIVSGDTRAWETFFNRFADWAYRFAASHLAYSRADAEDLCSDILMTAAKSMKRFDPNQAPLDAWLAGLARNRLARFCRKRRIDRGRLAKAQESPSRDAAGDLSASSQDTALLRIEVNRALANLPQRQAELLIGKYLHGYSVKELAAQANCTPKAAESLLSRAREALRASLQECLRDSKKE